MHEPGAEAPSRQELQTAVSEHPPRSHTPEHILPGDPLLHDLRILAYRSDLEERPRTVSLAELARQAIEGLDHTAEMDRLEDRSVGTTTVALWPRKGRRLLT